MSAMNSLDLTRWKMPIQACGCGHCSAAADANGVIVMWGGDIYGPIDPPDWVDVKAWLDAYNMGTLPSDAGVVKLEAFRMKTCGCGAEATYGKDCGLHAYYCDLWVNV